MYKHADKFKNNSRFFPKLPKHKPYFKYHNFNKKNIVVSLSSTQF